MNAERHRPLIARLILAWFVWVLGAAVASPLLNPDSGSLGATLVCSGAGAKLIPTGADTSNGGAGDDAASGAMGLDCPLCAVTAPPSALGSTGPCVIAAPGMCPPGALSAPWGLRAAAPLPARGPPLLS